MLIRVVVVIGQEFVGEMVGRSDTARPAGVVSLTAIFDRDAELESQSTGPKPCRQ